MMHKGYVKEFIEEIRTRWSTAAVEIHSARRLYIKIRALDAHALARFLFEEKMMRLSIATGIDTRDGMRNPLPLFP